LSKRLKKKLIVPEDDEEEDQSRNMRGLNQLTVPGDNQIEELGVS